MPGKRHGKRGRPRRKTATRKGKTATVESMNDEPTVGPTMPCKRPRCCKCRGIRQQAEKTTEEAGSSGHEAIRGEPTTGPMKPSFGRGKRVSSGRGHWELFREIKFEGSAHSCYLAIAARDDEIAVVDTWGKRVVIFSIDGKQKSTIQLQTCPCGIAVEPIHNRFVVIETNYDPKGKVFNSDNSLAYEFPTMPAGEYASPRFSMTKGVAVKKDGTILVAYDQGWMYTEHKPSDGELLRTVPVKLRPAHLAVDNKDRVIISHCGVIVFVAVTDGNGHTLFTIEPTILGKPAKFCLDVYADSSGIYVTMQGPRYKGQGHIHHYDLDGRFLDCLVRDLHNPLGITFTPDGQLAVADELSVKMFHKV